jgi:hypothetical protein
VRHKCATSAPRVRHWKVSAHVIFGYLDSAVCAYTNTLQSEIHLYYAKQDNGLGIEDANLTSTKHI